MAALSESRGWEETILSALGSFAVEHKSFCHSAYIHITGPGHPQSIGGAVIFWGAD